MFPTNAYTDVVTRIAYTDVVTRMLPTNQHEMTNSVTIKTHGRLVILQ